MLSLADLILNEGHSVHCFLALTGVWLCSNGRNTLAAVCPPSYDYGLLRHFLAQARCTCSNVYTDTDKKSSALNLRSWALPKKYRSIQKLGILENPYSWAWGFSGVKSKIKIKLSALPVDTHPRRWGFLECTNSSREIVFIGMCTSLPCRKRTSRQWLLHGEYEYVLHNF